MNRIKILVNTLLIVAMVFGFNSFTSPVLAENTPPALPSGFYGEIQFVTAAPNSGDYVEAYVEGISSYVVRDVIETYQTTKLVYALNIPGDDPTTPDKDGGLEGDSVTFKISDRIVATGTWHSGTNVNLNLHPPQPYLDGPYMAVSGEPVSFSPTVSDVFSTDEFTYAWDLDEDGQYDDSTEVSTSYTFYQGVKTVRVKATDNQGGEGTATASVYVVTISGLTDQTYDGKSKSIVVDGAPHGYFITYDGSSTRPIDAGSYTVVISIYEDSSQTTVGTITKTMIINKADQTITVTQSAPTTAYYGQSFSVVATSSSGLAVTYSSGNTSVCTNVGSTFTMVSGTGVCPVQYDQAGNTNYNAATQISQNVTADALTISGNADIEGVTLNYTDGTAKSVLTDATGAYSFMVPFNWSGTVTPSKTGYTFTPTNRSYTNVITSKTEQDYAATAIVFTISGNAGVGGATLSYTDGTAKTATADSTGAYSFTVSYNWSGTVTPTKTGYTFTPTFKEYSNVLADKLNENYTAAANSYTISGNAGVAGATLSYTDGTAKTATADTTGAYSFTVSYNWSGTVTPTKTGYTFTPANKTYTNVIADHEDQDYTATLITYLLDVTKLGSGSGSVVSSPAGIDCGTTSCSSLFNYNTVVTLTATAQSGSKFTGWGGACSGTGTCTVTMDAAKSVTATFYNVHSIALNAGWNLVSFNLIPVSTDIADVLASIVGKYELVFAWDETGASSASGNWLMYDPDITIGQSLSSLTNDMGFWINMSEGATLQLVGTPPTSTDVSLDNAAGGWNLVGYPSAVSASLPGVLTDNGVTNAGLIYAFHAAEIPQWLLYDPAAAPYANTLSAMGPGWGYWIKVSADSTWQVGYNTP